jgi:hypothetical protein
MIDSTETAATKERHKITSYNLQNFCQNLISCKEKSIFVACQFLTDFANVAVKYLL